MVPPIKISARCENFMETSLLIAKSGVTSVTILSHGQNLAETSLLVARNGATSATILSHGQNLAETSLLVTRNDSTSATIPRRPFRGQNFAETSLLAARNGASNYFNTWTKSCGDRSTAVRNGATSATIILGRGKILRRALC